jgi:hypothetical protein
MGRSYTVSILSLLIVLGIAAVLAFFLVPILYQPGLVSLVVKLVLAILALLFFAVLTLVGCVLLIVMLADRIHHYTVLRAQRELQRKPPVTHRPRILRVPLAIRQITGVS